MVRIAGSVSDENSLTDPIGELLRSVVRRMSGKSANRISGTESNAPTNTEPTPNNAPRNERRFCREGSAAADFCPTISGFSAYISTSLPMDVHENSCTQRFLNAFAQIIYFFGNAR